ncbi:MAG: cyclic nucleotide-binding domain-containing protein, partial [Thermoleophilia bacterium]|nr:cyclic nucleotide-binding domain-containing protein [Thermoleophilia bacterium]
MAPTGASLLDGLAPRERADIVAPLERRRFPAGAVVIAPGDVLRVTYLVESGSADVIVRDAGGREQRLSPISAGETLGEMSFLTGEPAACTVRAATDLDVVVLGEADLDRVSTQYPRVYRNLGAILSQRLARTTRRAVAGLPSRLTVLADGGSPPLLGYALACSIAWHTRAPTLLVVLGDQTSDPIAAVAGTRGPPGEPVVARNGDAPADAGAHVIVKRPEGAFAPDALPVTLEDLFRTYAHVLVQAPASSAPVLQTARVVQLAGSPEQAAAGGGPPGHTIRGWADADLGGRPDRVGVVHVPPPDAGDEDHLARGVLPAGSSSGRALAWAARDLAGLQVGLALGAGSVR